MQHPVATRAISFARHNAISLFKDIYSPRYCFCDFTYYKQSNRWFQEPVLLQDSHEECEKDNSSEPCDENESESTCSTSENDETGNDSHLSKGDRKLHRKVFHLFSYNCTVSMRVFISQICV